MVSGSYLKGPVQNITSPIWWLWCSELFWRLQQLNQPTQKNFKQVVAQKASWGNGQKEYLPVDSRSCGDSCPACARPTWKINCAFCLKCGCSTGFLKYLNPNLESRWVEGKQVDQLCKDSSRSTLPMTPGFGSEEMLVVNSKTEYTGKRTACTKLAAS